MIFFFSLISGHANIYSGADYQYYKTVIRMKALIMVI